MVSVCPPWKVYCEFITTEEAIMRYCHTVYLKEIRYQSYIMLPIWLTWLFMAKEWFSKLIWNTLDVFQTICTDTQHVIYIMGNIKIDKQAPVSPVIN
jgi:hypothetical protein